MAHLFTVAAARVSAVVACSIAAAATLAVALNLAWCPAARAQSQDTGSIVVRVHDGNELPLPGVTVSIAGSRGVHTLPTGTDGSVRFRGLHPGVYTAHLELEGFVTHQEEGLRVDVGRTIPLNVTLTSFGVEETVRVTAERALVDPTSTSVSTLYTNEMIELSPTASGIWAGVLDHVPGVVLTSVDIGGAAAGQQPAFSARGAGNSQNVLNINGAVANDTRGRGGGTLMYVSIDSFEQVGVSTAAHDIGLQTPGVAVNMVTKSGADSWHGAAKALWESDAFVADNIDDDLRERGAGEGNPPTLLADLDLQVGGPIVRGRAWFFLDYWDFQVERRIIGLPADDLDDTELRNWSLNGDWQVNDHHRVSLRYLTSRKQQDNRGATAFRPPPSAVLFDAFTDAPQLQWQTDFGPRTFLDLRLSRFDADATFEAKDTDSRRPHPGFQADLPPTRDLRSGAAQGWPDEERFTGSQRTQLSGSLSHFAGLGPQAHDLRFGGGYQRLRSFDAVAVPFGVQQTVDGAESIGVSLFNTPRAAVVDLEPPDGELLAGEAVDLFVTDTWNLGERLVITAGVRWDWSQTSSLVQRRLDSVWAGLIPEGQNGAAFRAVEFPAVEPVTRWSDVVPRIGAIYDLRGDGRTAVKASYNRYSSQQATAWAREVNVNRPGSNGYLWNDANRDGVFQWGEQGRFIGTNLPSALEIDPDLESPITQEFIASVEHEPIDDLLLRFDFFRRWVDNAIDLVNVGVPWGPLAARLGVPDPYAPISVVDPGPDGIEGTGDDGGPLTIFAQDPSTIGAERLLLTNPRNSGFDTFNDYAGFSFVAHKRWSGRWQLQASWDIAAVSDYGGRAELITSVFRDPNRNANRAGAGFWDRSHIVKVTGNYLFAEPVGVNLGTFLRIQSGRALTRRADIRDARLPQRRVNVRVAPPTEDPVGPRRLDTLVLLDVRAEKQFRLGRYGRLDASLDVFNLFNANMVLNQVENSGPVFGTVLELVPPRVLRIGARWSF